MEQITLGGLDDFTQKLELNHILAKDLSDIIKKISTFTLSTEKKSKDIQDVVFFDEEYIYATDGYKAIKIKNNTSVKNLLTIDKLKEVVKGCKKDEVIKLDFELNIDSNHKDKFIEIFKKSEENMHEVIVEKEKIKQDLKEIDEKIKFSKENKNKNYDEDGEVKKVEEIVMRAKEIMVNFEYDTLLINKDYLRNIITSISDEKIKIRYSDRSSKIEFEATNEFMILMPIVYHEYEKEYCYNINI